jgi:hypothetical protein
MTYKLSLIPKENSKVNTQFEYYLIISFTILAVFALMCISYIIHFLFLNNNAKFTLFFKSKIKLESL